MDVRGSTPVMTGIAGLAGIADAWISDIWGVLHNGLVAYPPAAQACVRFRQHGGTVVLVSNAPRPAAEVAAMLARLGIPRGAYDAIITSGDVTCDMIGDFGTVPIYHLGPERYVAGAPDLTDRLVAPDKAGLVMCTGLFDDETESPEDYRAMLAKLAARQVPLICANPDLFVERGNRVVPCAGALAAIYAELGAPVHFAGKPHAPIYARAYAAIAAARGSVVPKSRILAIGDGLRTDIEGARREHLRSIFIASALHVAEGETLDQPKVGALFADDPAPPVAAMAALAW